MKTVNMKMSINVTFLYNPYLWRS